MRTSDPLVAKARKAAQAALKRAYSPYSKFPVGAAVVTIDRRIFSGCNVENASYGLTMCAERNAVFQAVSKGHKHIRAIVIVTPTDEPTSPCGACRQVINEFAPECDVFSFTHQGQVLRGNLQQLLPDAFGPKSVRS